MSLRQRGLHTFICMDVYIYIFYMYIEYTSGYNVYGSMCTSSDISMARQFVDCYWCRGSNTPGCETLGAVVLAVLGSA